MASPPTTQPPTRTLKHVPWHQLEPSQVPTLSLHQFLARYLVHHHQPPLQQLQWFTSMVAAYQRSFLHTITVDHRNDSPLGVPDPNFVLISTPDGPQIAHCAFLTDEGAVFLRVGNSAGVPDCFSITSRDGLELSSVRRAQLPIQRDLGGPNSPDPVTPTGALV